MMMMDDDGSNDDDGFYDGDLEEQQTKLSVMTATNGYVHIVGKRASQRAFPSGREAGRKQFEQIQNGAIC